MTMPHIAVVGCGFLGSIFITEFLKRAYAGKIPHRYLFIDGDTWEPRNAANQNVELGEAEEGIFKAVSMGNLANCYGRQADTITERITPKNSGILGDKDDLVLLVDAVDNLPTRQLLYTRGLGLGVPVVHLGISEMGTGCVEWSHPQHDYFHLAPRHTIGKEIKEPESGVLPPCELARMRGLGLNVGFAGAMSAAMYFGFDPECNQPPDSSGWLTEWAATPNGHQPIRESWSRIEEET